MYLLLNNYKILIQIHVIATGKTPSRMNFTLLEAFTIKSTQYAVALMYGSVRTV